MPLLAGHLFQTHCPVSDGLKEARNVGKDLEMSNSKEVYKFSQCVKVILDSFSLELATFNSRVEPLVFQLELRRWETFDRKINFAQYGHYLMFHLLGTAGWNASS